MGRYETLNAASKDVVDCLIPGIASNFGVTDVVNVIPSDIRMRAWDCARKEHIFDMPEEDPRNWGLQFLKDLISISRIKQGKLEEFQADLRKKVENHEPEHPWAKLADIKELKQQYEAPERTLPSDELLPPEEESSSESSYYEELVEPEQSGPNKRGRRSGDHFEARKVKLNSQRNARKRLRRSSNAGWERPERSKRHAVPHDITVEEEVNDDDLEGMSVDELEAHLLVSQAELKAARLKLKVIEARRRAARERKTPSSGKVEQNRKLGQDRNTDHVRKHAYVHNHEYGMVPTSVREPDYPRNIEHFEHDRTPELARRSTHDINTGYARKSDIDRKKNLKNHGYIHAKDDKRSKEPTRQSAPSLLAAYGRTGEDHQVQEGSSQSP